MPIALQAKLLKAIDEGTVRRLGSTRNESVNVAIVTASNEDLRNAMREKRFREDLYSRIAVLTLELPPLRTREGDIELLAERFLARACEDYGIPAKTGRPCARRTSPNGYTDSFDAGSRRKGRCPPKMLRPSCSFRGQWSDQAPED